eukprot:SAG22_NODE_154_length_17189_cov_38.210064_13_plen_209_part_00
MPSGDGGGDDDWETDPDYEDGQAGPRHQGSGVPIPSTVIAAVEAAHAVAYSPAAAAAAATAAATAGGAGGGGCGGSGAGPEPEPEPEGQAPGAGSASAAPPGAADAAPSEPVEPLTGAERARLVASGMFEDDIDEAISEEPGCLAAFRAAAATSPEEAMAAFRAAVMRIMYSDPSAVGAALADDDNDDWAADGAPLPGGLTLHPPPPQ